VKMKFGIGSEQLHFDYLIKILLVWFVEIQFPKLNYESKSLQLWLWIKPYIPIWR